jgi:hypothetical protein
MDDSLVVGIFIFVFVAALLSIITRPRRSR